MINVCLAGATGWAGSELARAIGRTDDLALVAAVSRKHAGRTLGEALGDRDLTCSVYSSVAEALDAIRAGSISATVSQYPFVMGQMAVEACVAAQAPQSSWSAGRLQPRVADAL